MNNSFPASIEAVDCAWLTRALVSSGHLTGGRVSAFESERIEEGYTSTIYRLMLNYHNHCGNPPPSLVIKYHSDTASIRDTFSKLDIYQKEVRFYQFIDADLNLPVPACYAAEFNPVNGDFVLLLQDLSKARPVIWEPDPISDMRIAIPQLARIHAQFWEDPKLDQLEWVVKPTRSPEREDILADWTDVLGRTKQQYRDLWPERHWQLCDKITQNWSSIMACLDKHEHSLVHSDAHLGQMFFPTDKLPDFYLFDWQYPSKSVAAEDLAHLIANELTVDQRRDHESSLIDLYHSSLCRSGVTGFSREQLWFQCRLCLIWLILMYMRTTAEPDLLKILDQEARDEGEKWEDWTFGSLGPAMDDWKLDEAIDQVIDQAIKDSSRD